MYCLHIIIFTTRQNGQGILAIEDFVARSQKDTFEILAPLILKRNRDLIEEKTETNQEALRIYRVNSKRTNPELLQEIRNICTWIRKDVSEEKDDRRQILEKPTVFGEEFSDDKKHYMSEPSDTAICVTLISPEDVETQYIKDTFSKKLPLILYGKESTKK
jgi:hypothetical protein